jgi:hypothetical protein
MTIKNFFCLFCIYVQAIVLQNVEIQNAELQNVENTKRRIAYVKLQNVESYKTLKYKMMNLTERWNTKRRKY